MSQEVIENGINNQIEKMIDALPECLKKNAESIGINVQEQIPQLVDASLVVKNITTNVPYLSQPTKEQVYNLSRKKLYNLDLVKKGFDLNYERFKSGESCDNTSPFAQVAIAVSLNYLNRDDIENKIIAEFDSWYHEMKMTTDKRVAAKKPWVGFSSYNALQCYKESKGKLFKRFIEIDLQDYILYYSKTNEMPVIYFPSAVMNLGLFAAGRKGGRINKISFLGDIEKSPSGRIGGIITGNPNIISPELQMVVSGKDEQSVLMWLFTKAVQNHTGDMVNFEISGSLIDICHSIWPDKKRYSSKDYEYAKEIFSHLLYTRIWDKDMQTSVPLLGKTSAEWMDGGEGTHFTARLGQDLMSDIVFSRIGLVFRDQISQLNSPSGLSKLLYPKLRKDRATSIKMHDLYTSTYTLIALPFIAKPVSRYKPQRIKEYKEAFQELKDKKILIEEFEFTRLPSGDEAFILTWKPLTEAEEKDVSIIDINKDGKERIAENFIEN